jgi:hypothetical protein
VNSTLLNDELDDIQVSAPTNVTPSTPNVNHPAATTVPATAPTVDNDDEGRVNFLDSERLRAKSILASIAPQESGKGVRFFLPGGPAFQKPTHFLLKLGARGGSVLCPGENCPMCAKGDRPSKKIVTLAIRYTNTNSEGRFPAGVVKPELAVGFLSLSPTAYSELDACPSDNETLYTCDFRVSKKTAGLGYVYNRQGSPTTVAKVGMEAEVAALIAPFLDGEILRSRLGKKVTVAELRLLMTGESEGPKSDLSFAAALSSLE